MKKIAYALGLVFISSSIILGQPDSTSGMFTSFDKTKIYFETHGKGKPILFIHGFTSMGDSWKELLYTTNC